MLVPPSSTLLDEFRAIIFRQRWFKLCWNLEQKSIGTRNREGRGLSYRPATDGIFKLLRSPGIDSASLCSPAVRYEKSIITRFLAPINCFKISAQAT
jgi:hypothetical protein